MILKIVIAGCRNYNNYDEAKDYIDFCIREIKKNNTIVILSGGCRGADAIGERYAIENGYEIRKFVADWDKYGKAAGPIRNEQMAKDADYIICFWDYKSRGTKSMIENAKKYSKPYKIKNISLIKK